MSAEKSILERALANQLVAISVSDSPDLGRLGLLERSLRQTVAALATRLVSHGARIAYGGNLDQKGFTYSLYPAIAEAYATAAVRAARPPFVHYVATYLMQDPAVVSAHINAVGSFTEVRLIDAKREVTSIVASGKGILSRSAKKEIPLNDTATMAAFIADLPHDSSKPADDLDVMRSVMEDDVTARIAIGGRVIGYSGRMPGILQEVLLTLQRNHALYLLGGFGGAARDAAIALGLLSSKDTIEHREVGSAYLETLQVIGEFASEFRERARMIGVWDDLVSAAKAEDPDVASRHVMRGLTRHAHFRSRL
jgi:SLOG-like protein